MRFLVFVALIFMLPTVGVAAIEVEDDSGRTVVLEAPAQRLVALAPHIVETLFAAGVGDRLVGAVEHSDYPASAREIPRVGNYQLFSVEAIVRLKPDLVLAWNSGNSAQAIAQLRSLGFPVYESRPRRLEDIGRAMARIARLTAEPEAQRAAENYFSQLQALRQRYWQLPPVDVFYQVWNDPLQTLNGEHLFSDVLGLCGGRNIFAEESALAPRIGLEAVLRADPQVIIASGMAEERPEWLDDWRRWTDLQAVQEQQLYFVPPDLVQRHAPRVLQGAEIICGQLQQARAVYGIQG